MRYKLPERGVTFEEFWKLNARVENLEEANQELCGCFDEFSQLSPENKDIVLAMVPEFLRQAAGNKYELVRLLKAHIDLYMPGGHSDLEYNEATKKKSDKRRIDRYVEKKSREDKNDPKREYVH